MRMIKAQQRGDTIIEVLFCIMIIGSALVMAFQTANRSLIALQRSQERSEALKLAEQQLESLRYVSRSANANEQNLFYDKLNTTPSVCLVSGQPATGDGAILNISAINMQVYHSANSDRCRTNDLYIASIQTTRHPDSTLGAYYDFTIRITWDALTGAAAAQESVELFYRLNQEQL